MSFTTFSILGEVMKSGDSAYVGWQNYSNPTQITTSLLPSYDLASPSTLGSSYSGVSGSSYQMMPNNRQPPPCIKNNSPSLPRPPLKSHHSYPSLKRSYQAYEQSQYSENASDLYDVAPDIENPRKPTMNPDHRLLSFGQTQARHNILDQYGRPSSVEITAQMHGMFFLSEIATNSGETIVIQPELTCYRRNLFQISGSITNPTGPISVLTEKGQTVQVVSQELSVSATESVDGHVIRLIVIPWKTPPPNSPEVPRNQEQEPPTILLDSNANGGQEINSEVTVQPISWKRLQFRVATANNGRRKELQQHFVLRLTLNAILADNTKLCIAEAATAPIVVRGRSPRNFQARKEIPLVGSSASPRGHTIQSSPADKKAGLQSEKTQNHKPQHVGLPKGPFVNHGKNLPPSPQLLRRGFNHWATPQAELEQATVTTTTPAYTPPHVISQGFLQTSLSDPDITRLNAIPASHPQLPDTEGNTRSQYYQITTALSPSPVSFQFIDDNPRPAKMARHAESLNPSTGPSYITFEERQLPLYSALSPANDAVQQSREYFSAIIEPETWSTAENGHVMYSASMVPPSQQHATFSAQSFPKGEPLPSNYTWSAA